MADFSQCSDAELIAALARRRPDLVVVPRRASFIMALRGTQATQVFNALPNRDFVTDYLNLDEVGKIPGFADLEDSIDVDERAWLVAAAAWRGCIQGFEEWERYRVRKGETPEVLSWLKPCVLRPEAETPPIAESAAPGKS